MGVTWSKGRLFLFILAIVLVNPIVMVDQVLTPIINNLYLAFPNDESQVTCSSRPRRSSRYSASRCRCCSARSASAR